MAIPLCISDQIHQQPRKRLKRRVRISKGLMGWIKEKLSDVSMPSGLGDSPAVAAPTRTSAPPVGGGASKTSVQSVTPVAEKVDATGRKYKYSAHKGSTVIFTDDKITWYDSQGKVLK